MDLRSSTMLHASGLGFSLGVAAYALGVSSLAAQAARAQEATQTSGEAAQSDEAELTPMCQTAVRLSGAVYNATHPERSFAVFEAEKSHAGSVYRVGTWIAGMELVEVAPRGVILRGPAGECWLRLVPDATAARAEPPPRTRKPARSKRAKRPSKSEVAVIGASSGR